MVFIIKRALQGFFTVLFPCLFMIYLLANTPIVALSILGVVVVAVMSLVVGFEIYGREDE